LPRRRRAESTPPHRAVTAPGPAARGEAAPALPAGGGPVPVWRDRWAWVSVLAVIPLVLHSLGAPLGEPFADDFDYLKRTLLEGGGSFFDGCGSVLYWRPLGRQVYYGLLGPLIVTRPGFVAALHVLALALASLLLYRALRLRWPGPWAAAAASFVLLAESTRMLVAWPSHFMDLGALLCVTLALHEAAHRRLWSTLLAIAASLLFKEVGLLAALVVPWFPAGRPRATAERLRWSAACAATVAAWGIAYLVVTRHAGLALPHQFEPGADTQPWPARFGWALWNSARAQFSLAADRGAWDPWIAAAVIALLAVAAWRYATHAPSRVRLAASRPWFGWGAVWFVAGVAPLTEVFPAWAPYRSAFGGIGLGVALVALFAPLGSWFIAALVGLRLVAFALSPGPPAQVTADPTETGAAFDFPKLVRLERFVRGTRVLLAERHPGFPKGVRVGQHHLPHMTEYALSGDKALQVWYRDTTARWVRWEQFQQNLDLPLATIVEYQPHRPAQLALVSPDAVRALYRAFDRGDRSEWAAARAELERADSGQQDRNAAVFLGTVIGKLALARGVLEGGDAAEAEAWRAYGFWPDNPDSRLVLAQRRFEQGRLAEAASLLDTLLAQTPTDKYALALRRRVLAAGAWPRK
jgi:hypothetical protein